MVQSRVSDGNGEEGHTGWEVIKSCLEKFPEQIALYFDQFFRFVVIAGAECCIWKGGQADSGHAKHLAPDVYRSVSWALCLKISDSPIGQQRRNTVEAASWGDGRRQLMSAVSSFFVWAELSPGWVHILPPKKAHSEIPPSPKFLTAHNCIHQLKTQFKFRMSYPMLT